MIPMHGDSYQDFKHHKTFTDEEKKDLDTFLSYAVKEGCIDEDTALEMSYSDKNDYFDKSEDYANRNED